MKPLDRRGFLKLAGASGAAAALTAATPAQAKASAARKTPALLIDTSKCIGCRACEAACTEVNGQPAPDKCGDPTVFDTDRPLSPDRYTIVNRVQDAADGKPERFAKKQCMHCIEPACASACLARALDKTPEGPVVYHKERCIGCRYCMIACPFEIPTFEYMSNTPRIQKCQFCFERQANGKQPACADACPSGALTFGTRDELLDVAKHRVYGDPDKYVQHIYGENEAGGTSVLYISDLPFDQLGLSTKVAEESYPKLTAGVLGTVPFVMTLWPPLLMGIRSFMQRAKETSAEEALAKKEDHHG